MGKVYFFQQHHQDEGSDLGREPGVDEGIALTEDETVVAEIRCLTDVDLRKYAPPSVEVVKKEEDDPGVAPINDSLIKDVSEEIDDVKYVICYNNNF